VTCSFVITDAWESTANAMLSISNGSATKITSWTVRIAHGGSTIRLWSASGARSADTALTATDDGWNGTVGAGDTTKVSGASLSGSKFSDDQSFECAVVPTAPETDTVTCSFVVYDGWGEAGNGTLSISNGSSSKVTSWTVKIATTSTKSVTLWNAKNTVGASSVTASSLSWNGVVEAGKTASPTDGKMSGPGITKGDSLDCTVVRVS
jgi:hypothetical protein